MRWLSRTLGQRGFTVAAATSVQEALARIRELRPDAAVVDHVLPDGDGTELAARLQRAVPGIRIVMMSGFEVGEEERLFCLRHDLPHLAKPFLSEELFRILDSLDARPPKKSVARGA